LRVNTPGGMSANGRLGKAGQTSGATPFASAVAWLRKTATRARPHLGPAIVGFVAGVAVLAFATAAASAVPKFNDFYRESWPAYAALAHGHVLAFLRLGPAYVGSLVLRAPFALIPGGGAGWRAVYFASALPCVIGVAAFCVWLAAQPRRGGGSSGARRVVPIVCCVLNWLVVSALLGGHPEEVLGAALCVGAVVLGVNGRPGWAGLLVGLAVVNKSWALVAIPAVIVTMPTGRRKAALVAAATAAAVLLPVLAVRNHGFSGVATGAQIGTIFNPPQLLWWFGSHSWIVQHARPGIVLASIVCASLWWVRDPRGASPPRGMGDALLLLALVMLLRAALDPWNNLYYHVPFVFALVAYEMRSGRMPLLSVLYSGAFMLVVPVSGALHMSPDLQSAAYAGLVIPAIACISAKLYLPSGIWEPLSAARRRHPARVRVNEREATHPTFV
jgi:hypothetical protein